MYHIKRSKLFDISEIMKKVKVLKHTVSAEKSSLLI